MFIIFEFEGFLILVIVYRDKIAALFALLLAKDVLKAVSATVQAEHVAAASFSFGVVQTAALLIIICEASELNRP